ncbi:unnamed protein product [Brugia pahangi]|uniref:Glyco_hydro_38C domain-containing protein n=1 Tax=Brugia pahangi TaxID=6280 RepID=A0A0N4SXW9_BRUPA|nr:unnamed protein product [Brugia pahangi]
MYLPRITFSFADGIESYKIQIVSQKTFSTMELVKINVSSPFITVTHNDKLLTIQVVRILKQSDLFEVRIKLVYNDGSMETNFALYFNRINDYGGAYTMVSAGLSLENITDKNRLSPTIIQGPIYSSITQQLSSQLAYSFTIINSTDDNARSIQIDLFTNVTLSPGYDRKMKLEANIYPMITETVIEDDKLRCTVLGAQSTGVTAKMGLVTLMVDREMYNDDGKGLDYYEASESHPSHLRYRIIFEPKTSEMKDFDDLKTIDKNELKNKSSPMNTMYHSQLVQQTLEELLYPAALFLSSSINSTDNNEMSSVLIDLPRLPDNIQLITIRYIARKTILLSMRQLPYDCSVKLYCKSDSNTV